MEIKVNYQKFKAYAEKHGLDGLLRYMKNQYPKAGINRLITVAWLFDHNKAAVFKGTNDDIVVNFTLIEAVQTTINM